MHILYYNFFSFTILFISSLFYFLLCISSIESNATPEQSPVLHLTAHNFFDTIRAYPLILILFYEAHGANLPTALSQLQIAAQNLSISHTNSVQLAALDCEVATEAEEMCRRVDQLNYPSYLIFLKHKAQHYDGDFTAASIIETMARFAEPGYVPASAYTMQLNNENFNSTLQNKPLALIMYYADWCFRCKSLFPVLDRVAQALATNKSNPQLASDILIGRVDGLSCMQLAVAANVTTYPQFFLYRYGVQYIYYGPQYNATDIIAHLIDYAQPSSKELLSVADIEEFVAKEAGIVAYFTSIDEILLGSQISAEILQFTGCYNEYLAFAHSQRHFHRFAHILNNSVARSAAIPLTPALQFYNPSHYRTALDSPIPALISPGNFTTRAMAAYLANFSFPLVPLILPHQQRVFLALNKPLLLVAFDASFASKHYARPETLYWREKLIHLQQNWPNFTVVMGNSWLWQQQLRLFGLELEGDLAAGIYNGDNSKFPMDLALFSANLAGLEQFLAHYSAGKAKKIRKSQKAIENRPNTGLNSVVAANFYEKIMKPTDFDVVLLIFAGYCGFCIEFVAPLMERLAVDLRSEKRLKFYEINGDLNDLGEFPRVWEGVQSYPAIVLIPAKNKQNPWFYKGNYEQANIIEWMKLGASQPINYESKEDLKKLKREERLKAKQSIEARSEHREL
jgi:thiol-disulfide isomerase/thioredoxin